MPGLRPDARDHTRAPMSRPVAPLLSILVLAALVWRPALALDASKNPAADLDDSDIEEQYLKQVLEDAAAYRLARTRHVSDPADDAAGAAYAEQARAILATGAPQPLESGSHWLAPQWWFFTPPKGKRAWWLGGDGFAAHPYSKAAGELLGIQIAGAAEIGDLTATHDALFRLWFFLPDYNALPVAMEHATAAAEKAQDFTTAIDLEQDDPRQVIRISSDSGASSIRKIFRFMVLHGDRESIAPRAALGLARALLRSGDKDEIWLARREYERFCETYPTHPLIFSALCERALSYLVSYRGAKYEVGVLFTAAGIIDQAEIEAKGDVAKTRTVEAYRRRIRLWLQDRDLDVARWYRDRVIPGLGWLMSPTGIADDGWLKASRHFYREVIRRDSSSPQARNAARELEELPPPTPDELGRPLTPAPAPAP